MALLNKIKSLLLDVLVYVKKFLFVLIKNRFYIIPYLLMSYAIFCYLGFGSEFLVKNYTVLFCIDTALFIISFLHYRKNILNYNKTTNNVFLGTFMFFILELTEWKLKFSDSVYMNIYLSIILFTIIKSIYDNLNENIKKRFKI